MDETQTQVTPETPVAPAAPVPSTEATVTPAPAALEMYDLPDGTKVDSEGLVKAWRDNFMPEYTRKSQENAALKAKLGPQPDTGPKELPWKQDPNWNANGYNDLEDPMRVIVRQELAEKEGRAAKEAQERQEVFDAEVKQLQSIDPKANVNKVIAHAQKFGFNSMIPAYQNLMAIEEADRRGEERATKNLKARAGDPVSGGGATTGTTEFPTGLSMREKIALFSQNNK